MNKNFSQKKDEHSTSTHNPTRISELDKKKTIERQVELGKKIFHENRKGFDYLVDK